MVYELVSHQVLLPFRPLAVLRLVLHHVVLHGSLLVLLLRVLQHLSELRVQVEDGWVPQLNRTRMRTGLGTN